jgi:hypothetical protein
VTVERIEQRTRARRLCVLIDRMKKVSKTIGLVAHDNRKKDLIEWVAWNSAILMHHRLVCTGTTGKLVEEALRARLEGTANPAPMPEIKKLKSGPLGGDQQLGALSRPPRICMTQPGQSIGHLGAPVLDVLQLALQDRGGDLRQLEE